jgi:hypothetical protein
MGDAAGRFRGAGSRKKDFSKPIDMQIGFFFFCGCHEMLRLLALALLFIP